MELMSDTALKNIFDASFNIILVKQGSSMLIIFMGFSAVILD